MMKTQLVQRFSFVLAGLLAASAGCSSGDDHDVSNSEDDSFLQYIPAGDSGKGDHSGVLYSIEQRAEDRWVIGLADKPAERVYRLLEAIDAEIETQNGQDFLVTENVRCIVRDGVYGCALFSPTKPSEFQKVVTIEAHKDDYDSAAQTIYRGLSQKEFIPLGAFSVLSENMRCEAPSLNFPDQGYRCDILISSDPGVFPDETEDFEGTQLLEDEGELVIVGQASLFIANLIERTGEAYPYMGTPQSWESAHFNCEGKMPMIECVVEVGGFGEQYESYPDGDIALAFRGAEDSAAAELYTRLKDFHGLSDEEAAEWKELYYGPLNCSKDGSSMDNYSCRIAISSNSFHTLSLIDQPDFRVAYGMRTFFDAQVSVFGQPARELIELFERAKLQDEYGDIYNENIDCMVGPEGEACSLSVSSFETPTGHNLYSSPTASLPDSGESTHPSKPYLFKVSADISPSAGEDIMNLVAEYDRGFDSNARFRYGHWECYNRFPESTSFCYLMAPSE